ncbi:MAG TPA: DUF6084 family protein [Pyrinomonadaceae bacterium]
MPDLNFSVESAEVMQFAASPMLIFKLKVSEGKEGTSPTKIQSVALRCQVQIETTKRRYSEDEQKKLVELFGEPERWGRTLRAMLWTHTNVTVGSFQGDTVVDLTVPCTFDFNVAATKYFAGLTEGVVPLNLMFSGSVFYESDDFGLQVEQISWNKEAPFRLPISVWQEMMDHYYPNTAWLCLRRDVFEQLSRYKVENGMTTWEQALERIIPPPRPVSFDDDLAVEGSLPS